MRWSVVALILLPPTWLIAALLTASALELTPAAPESAVNDSSFCGRPLEVATGDGHVHRAASTRVVLALDEEWQAAHEDGGATAARSLLLEASGLFRGLAIHLLTVRIQTWRSPDSLNSAEELWRSSQGAVPLGDSDILIVLTGQPLDGGDGYAGIGGRHALVVRHPDHPEQDAMVLAHEVAHLFGARHGCDLPGRSGLMAAQGFEEPSLVCPCTRGVLEQNAARFHSNRDGQDGEALSR